MTTKAKNAECNYFVTGILEEDGDDEEDSYDLEVRELDISESKDINPTV